MSYSSIFELSDKFNVQSPLSNPLPTTPSKSVKIVYVKTAYTGSDYFLYSGEYLISLRVTAVGLSSKHAKITLSPYLESTPVLLHFEERRTTLLNNGSTTIEFKITKAGLDLINSLSTTSSNQKYIVRIEVDSLEAITSTFDIKEDLLSTSIKPPHGRKAIQALFGNPANDDGTLNSTWEQANIILVKPKNWKLFYQNDSKLVPILGIRMHQLIAPNFYNAMAEIWNFAKNQAGPGANDDTIRHWLQKRRLNITSGGFNFRKIAGKNFLSLHSFGIAIDWDPIHNPHIAPLTKTLPKWWYDIWSKWGFSNGLHFTPPDPMHIQFATGA